METDRETRRRDEGNDTEKRETEEQRYRGGKEVDINWRNIVHREEI